MTVKCPTLVWLMTYNPTCLSFSVFSLSKTWLALFFDVLCFAVFMPSRFYVSQFCVRGFRFRYFETVEVLCFAVLCSRFCVSRFCVRGFQRRPEILADENRKIAESEKFVGNRGESETGGKCIIASEGMDVPATL